MLSGGWLHARLNSEPGLMGLVGLAGDGGSQRDPVWRAVEAEVEVPTCKLGGIERDGAGSRRVPCRFLLDLKEIPSSCRPPFPHLLPLRTTYYVVIPSVPRALALTRPPFPAHLISHPPLLHHYQLPKPELLPFPRLLLFPPFPLTRSISSSFAKQRPHSILM